MASKYRKIERENKLAKALEAKNEEIEMWFSTYDKDQSGDIDRHELKQMLTAVKRETSKDPAAAPVEDEILILVMKKYADESGRIKQDRILNAIKAFKSYLAQELTYKDLFAKCTRLNTHHSPSRPAPSPRPPVSPSPLAPSPRPLASPPLTPLTRRGITQRPS